MGILISFPTGSAGLVYSIDRFFGFVKTAVVQHHLKFGAKIGCLKIVNKQLKPGIFNGCSFCNVGGEGKNRWFTVNGVERIGIAICPTNLFGRRVKFGGH